jgi:hypothetical protein
MMLRPRGLCVVAMSALLVPVPVTATEAIGNPQAIEQKYDWSWAQHAVDETAATSGQIASQMGVATKTAMGGLSNLSGKVLGNFSGDLGGATNRLGSKLAKEGKTAAFRTVLQLLGTCPDYYQHADEIRVTTAKALAQSFQQRRAHGWPQDERSCQEAVQQGLDEAISRRMPKRDQKETATLGWIVQDRAHIFCTDELFSILRLFEPIRQGYREQYTEAVTAKLLLDVISTDMLLTEFDRVCGSGPAVQQLHSEGHELPVPTNSMQLVHHPRMPLQALICLALLPLAGLCALKFAWGCRLRARHGAFIEDEENRLMGINKQ